MDSTLSTPSAPKRQKTYQPAFDNIPEDGKPLEIAPGFYWLRMPLSFELSHINLWLMKSPEGGWAIVDAGFNTPETLAGWENAFALTGGAVQIKEIFITHFHPDHFGLAGDLHRLTKASVRMTSGEWDVVERLTAPGSIEQLEKLYTPYYIAAGVPQDLMMRMLDKRKLYQKIITPPPSDIIKVALGDEIALGGRQWLLIGGGGHTPEHACLYNTAEKIFIAGDIVLPDITPNISLFPGNDDAHDPLQDYYDTLQRVKAAVPDDVLVLPSHGVPFYGLHKRIGEIILHHEARCDKVRDICTAHSKTAHQIMEELFAHRKLSVSDLFFALSETIAHLEHDVKKDRIIKTSEDGVEFYLARK